MSTLPLPTTFEISLSALIELKGGAQNFRRLEPRSFESSSRPKTYLAEYVFGPADAVPEPDKSSKPNEYKIWKLARARAIRILYSTLNGEEGILDRLHSYYGWDVNYRNPAYVHQLVERVFGVDSGFGRRGW